MITLKIDVRLLALALMLSMSGAVAFGQTAPVGNGAVSVGGSGTVTSVTAGDTSITMGGTPGVSPTVALSTTQPNANTWTLAQTFSQGFTANGTAASFGANGFSSSGAAALTNFLSDTFNATTNCGPGGGFVVTEACFAGTSTVGIALSPICGAWTSCAGTNDSQQINFCRSVSGTVTCPAFIKLQSGGNFQFGGTSVVTGNQNFSVGTAVITSSAYNQNGSACSGSGSVSGPAGDTVCVITCASSAWSFTYGHTFTSTPVIEVTDESGGSTATITAKSATVASGACTTGHVLDVDVRGNSS